MKKSFLFFTLLSLLFILTSSLYSYEVIVNKSDKTEFKIEKTFPALVRDNSLQTVYDPNTNLIWQDDSSASSVKKDWNGAINYCKSLNFAGRSDWRLPTRMELHSITDKSKYNPAIKSGFKNVVSGNYWSSSPYVSDSSYAWYVYFGNGYDYYGIKSYSLYVRCVRVN